MASLLVVQHISREGPGLLAEIARERGLAVERCRAWAGDPLPRDHPADQLLAVMGGPMGVADLDNPDTPWLAPTLHLIRQRLELNRPILGVCLGAQLLALAAGGDAVPLMVGEPPLPLKEVGFGAISFTRPADQEPVLAGLAPSEVVLHWHGDRILMPPQATLLASSLHCPEQMFRVGRLAYGLQFHCEVGPADLARWLREDDAFVRTALGTGGLQRLREQASRWFPAVEGAWRQLLGNLLDACLG
jgi:GMP synthase (glutamine-hydrolysing)